jgi:hypothetical protein
VVALLRRATCGRPSVNRSSGPAEIRNLVARMAEENARMAHGFTMSLAEWQPPTTPGSKPVVGKELFRDCSVRARNTGRMEFSVGIVIDGALRTAVDKVGSELFTIVHKPAGSPKLIH